MKLYILCDLEGVAGVCDQVHQCSFIHDSYDNNYHAGTFGPFYLQARRLATLELNALVEGALAGGATEIVAWDGHCLFPGGLDAELLHPDCKLVMNAGDGGPLGLDNTVDALMLHGIHAKAGTPGAVLAHMEFPEQFNWNSKAIGEIGMTCAVAGWLRIPMILVSGDRAAIQEARAYTPDAELVIVKEALHDRAPGVMEHHPSIQLAPVKARQVLRQAGQRAIERSKQIAPPLKPPFNPLG
jgi:D-amino peptidase